MRRSFVPLLGMLTLLVGCQLDMDFGTQDRSSRRTTDSQQSARNTRVRIIDMTANKGLERSYAAHGAEWGKLIPGGLIDADNDGKLDDPEDFARHLRRVVPEGFDGVVGLDWEGPMMKWLSEPPGSPDFDRAIRRLREALAIAKNTRPQAQVGFYGIPVRQFWSYDKAWKEQSLAIADQLLRDADWIAPSLYTLYKTNDDVAPQKQEQYARQNTRMALEMAESIGGKPVFVWINHRYHVGHKSRAFDLVPEDEFVAHIREIVNTSYRGRRIDGVIWWGADSYYHRTGRVDVEGDPDRTLDRVHQHYLGILDGALHNSN